MSILDILKEAIGIPTKEEKEKAESESRLITNIFLGVAVFLGLMFIGFTVYTISKKK